MCISEEDLNQPEKPPPDLDAHEPQLYRTAALHVFRETLSETARQIRQDQTEQFDSVQCSYGGWMWGQHL